MNKNTLKLLEKKLLENINDEQDQYRYDELEKKYSGFFDEIIDFYALEGMLDLQEKIKIALRYTLIEEFFLQKKIYNYIAQLIYNSRH